jgi:hypothetical protein
MTNERLDDQLRAEPDPLELRYAARPLPASASEARELVDTRRARRGSTPWLAVTAVAAAAAIAMAAGSWLDGDGRSGIGADGSQSPASPTSAAPTASAPASADGAPCRSADLAVSSDAWDSGAGSRGTTIVFRVVDSAVGCRLGGALAGRITDGTGSILVEAQSESVPVATVTGTTQFEIGVAWSNWCGPEPARPLQMSVTLAGDDVAIPLVPPPGTEILVPPCMGAGQDSALSITGFQPSSRPSPEG